MDPGRPPLQEPQSDTRFREAFRYSPIGMALVDLDGTWMAVNDAVTKILGYDRPTLLARAFQDITYPEDLPGSVRNVERLLTGQAPYYRMEKRYLHREGRVVWADVTMTLVRDRHGTPSCFVSQIQDITARKDAERRRIESEGRYRALARSFSRGGVIMFDRDLRCTLAEGAGLVELGVDRHELEGRTLSEAFGDETAASLEPQYRAVLEGEESVMDVHYRSRIYHTRASPLRDADGAVVGGMVTAADITDRVHAEEAAARAQKLEGLVKLTAGMTHAFNNRFSAIVPALEMLRLDLYDHPRMLQELDLILEDARAGAEVVRQLAAFSLFEGGPAEWLYADDAIARALDRAHPALPAAVTLSFDPNAPDAWLKANATSLADALTALVINASEALPAGGEIRVRTDVVGARPTAAGEPTREGPHLRVAVVDDGVGMSEKVMARAFDPFFTTHDPAVRIGLGLATVHGFAKALGGGAALESVEGEGTTVTLYLPLPAVPAPTEE